MKVKISLILFSLTFMLACNEDDDNIPIPDQTWSYAGLGDHRVNEIKIINDQIVAATGNGMFQKNINTNDTSWTPIGLAGKGITDFIAFSTNEILAAVEINQENPAHTFYKSEDGGETWTPLQSNFGGQAGSMTAHAMDMHAEQPDVLYARGIANVAKSTDRG